jgi:hypothetical protein
MSPRAEQPVVGMAALAESKKEVLFVSPATYALPALSTTMP